MFLVKALGAAAAGLLSLVAIQHLVALAGMKRATVKAEARRPQRTVTKLRQDPRTGVYYPEE